MLDLMLFPFGPGSCQFAGPVTLIAGQGSDFVLPEYDDAVRGFFPPADICFGSGQSSDGNDNNDFNRQIDRICLLDTKPF